MARWTPIFLEKAIGDWIELINPEGYAGEICSRYGIHIGEAESILLARELDADLLLINERDGRRAAKNAGVKVKGAIGVISDCIERRILTAGVAVDILIIFRDNPSEFWTDPKIIDIAIKRIKNLSEEYNPVATL